MNSLLEHYVPKIPEYFKYMPREPFHTLLGLIQGVATGYLLDIVVGSAKDAPRFKHPLVRKILDPSFFRNMLIATQIAVEAVRIMQGDYKLIELYFDIPYIGSLALYPKIKERIKSGTEELEEIYPWLKILR